MADNLPDRSSVRLLTYEDLADWQGTDAPTL
jgi:hypothetical protein